MLEIKVEWAMRRKRNVCMIFKKTSCNCNGSQICQLEHDTDIMYRKEIADAIIGAAIEICSYADELCEISNSYNYVDVI